MFKYDLETDIRYLQGYEQGKTAAEKRIQEEVIEMKENTVKKLLQIKILNKERITETVGVTLAYVKEIEEKLKLEEGK